MMRSIMKSPAAAALKTTALRSFSAAPVSDFGKVTLRLHQSRTLFEDSTFHNGALTLSLHLSDFRTHSRVSSE